MGVFGFFFFLRLLLFSNLANQVSCSTKKQGIICVLTTKQRFQPTPRSCLSVRAFEQCREWLACEFGTGVCEEVLAWGCTENRKRWILTVRERCRTLILCCRILSVSSAEVAHAAAARVRPPSCRGHPSAFTFRFLFARNWQLTRHSPWVTVASLSQKCPFTRHLL